MFVFSPKGSGVVKVDFLDQKFSTLDDIAEAILFHAKEKHFIEAERVKTAILNICESGDIPHNVYLHIIDSSLVGIIMTGGEHTQAPYEYLKIIRICRGLAHN